MKVLITAPWNEDRLAELQAAFPQVEWARARTPEETLAQIGDTEVVFGHLNSEAVRAAKSLKWVQGHAAGVEWTASVPELADSDIQITNTRGAHAQTIAQHTIGMLVALARNFKLRFEEQGRREWTRFPEKPSVGLTGLTMGVVGLGNIGRAIAKAAWGIDMRVIAVDAYPVAKPDTVESVWGLDRLDDLLREADAVAIATPYTPETANLIDARRIGVMKQGAFLLVVSRGGIVDETALVAALKAGKLAGAGLDVQAVEPMVADDPLWDAPNIFLTPHGSGHSVQTTAGATNIFRDNLKRYLAGQPLENLVDVKRGF